MAVQENGFHFGQIVVAKQGDTVGYFVVTSANGSATTSGAPISKDTVRQLRSAPTKIDFSIDPTSISDIEGEIRETKHYVGSEQILQAGRRGAAQIFSDDFPAEIAASLAESTIAVFEATINDAINQEQNSSPTSE